MAGGGGDLGQRGVAEGGELVEVVSFELALEAGAHGREETTAELRGGEHGGDLGGCSLEAEPEHAKRLLSLAKFLEVAEVLLVDLGVRVGLVEVCGDVGGGGGTRGSRDGEGDGDGVGCAGQEVAEPR